MIKPLKICAHLLPIVGLICLTSPAISSTSQKKVTGDGSASNLCPKDAKYKARHDTTLDTKSAAELAALAEKGNAGAMVALGLRYIPAASGGEGSTEIAPDPAKALELFKAATDKGDDNGAFLMGIAYMNGVGVPKDDAQAMPWLIRAAKANNVQAQFWVGEFTAKGRGVPADWKAALPYFQRAAQGGWDVAFLELGFAYTYALGVKQDYQKAAFCYRQQRSLLLAQYNLRRLIDEGLVAWQPGDPGEMPDISNTLKKDQPDASSSPTHAAPQ